MSQLHDVTRPGPAGVAFPRLQLAFPWHGAMALSLFVGALFLANLLLKWPGELNNDSIQQYQQALSGQYFDWHPPVMAWFWSLLLPLGKGPAPMLLVHLALYWAGFGLLADGLRRAGHSRRAWAMAAAGAFPVFLYLNGVITKDVGMIATWMCALGLVFWFRVQGRRVNAPAIAAIALLLAYGTLVRANAIFSLGPLLVFALLPPTVKWLRLALAALAVAVLALPLSNFVNHQVLHARAQQPLHSLILFDLMGIAVHANDPSVLEPKVHLAQDELRGCYTPYWFDPLSPWGRCASRVERPAGSDFVVAPEGIEKQWMSAIVRHPVAYLEHRLKHFNSSILLAVPPKHIRLVPEYRPTDASFTALGTVTPAEVKWDIVRKNFLFWPATWIAWGIALMVFLGRQRATTQTGLAAALCVSALAYSCAYAVIGVHTDMRYHFWSLAALLCASLLAWPELVAGWRVRSRPLVYGLGGMALVIAIGTAARLADFRGFV